MKRIASFIMVMALLFSILPVVYAEESAESVEVLSLTDEAIADTGYVYEYTADVAGTLTITLGACSPACRYQVTMPDGSQSVFQRNTASFEGDAGTWKILLYAFNFSKWTEVEGTVSLTVTFTPKSEDSGEVEKSVYEVSKTALALGSNNVSLLETAETTIFTYTPAETGVYTFTAPEGAILGYWGGGTHFLSDPGSTTNTYEWTCTSVGQSACIGVSGVEGAFTLNVEKTGDYTVVEVTTLIYENKATLSPFALPGGTILHSYIDVTADTPYSAVLGEDGYYHLNSADGDVILVDMDYQTIILSDALESDRPVMYFYVEDEDGNKSVRYEISEAVLKYEAVMDENGYYPLTEDLIHFYKDYAVTSGVYAYYVLDDYNPDNVWMYCMRTVTFPESTDPTEPAEPEVTEPEVTEPEESEPVVSEPEITDPEETEPSEPVSSEPAATEPSEPESSEPADSNALLSLTNEVITKNGYVFEYTATADGTLNVELGNSSPACRYFFGSSLTFTYTSNSYEVTAGNTYKIKFYVYGSSGNTSGNLSVTVTFTPKDSGGDVEKKEYEVSGTALALGKNNVTMLETAVTTIFAFKPAATGTYVFTAPEGAILGYWGASPAYLRDPGSSTNTYEWTCSSVGQSVYIGVSGVEGTTTVNVAEKAAEPEKLVDKWNLVLDDDMLVNFHLNISDDIASTAQIQITIGGNSIIYNAVDLKKSDDGKRIASIHVAPAQMMDNITIQIVGSESASQPATYSIRQYSDTVLKDEANSQYHGIVKEMLNYGAAAQTYFGHNTENLANDGIDDAGASDVPETAAADMSTAGSASGIKFYAASLVFKDKIAVRFYFDAESIDGLTFTVNNTTRIPTLKNGYYMVEVGDISPENLDKQITVSVSDGSSSTLSVSYSPMNYIVRMNVKGSENMKALLKALYNYHLAAKQLRPETV